MRVSIDWNLTIIILFLNLDRPEHVNNPEGMFHFLKKEPYGY